MGSRRRLQKTKESEDEGSDSEFCVSEDDGPVEKPKKGASKTKKSKRVYDDDESDDDFGSLQTNNQTPRVTRRSKRIAAEEDENEVDPKPEADKAPTPRKTRRSKKIAADEDEEGDADSGSPSKAMDEDENDEEDEEDEEEESEQEVEEEEQGGCYICHSNTDMDSILLCDGCDAEYHTFCLDPPLEKIPTTEWHCPACTSGKAIIPTLSRWDHNIAEGRKVDLVLGQKPDGSKYYVKFSEKSYRVAKWMRMEDVAAIGGERKALNFTKKRGQFGDYGEDPAGGYFDARVTSIDRVLAARRDQKGGLMYLVKWRSLGYEDCTWEKDSALQSEEDRVAIKALEARQEAALAKIKQIKEGRSDDSSQRQKFGKELVEGIEWKDGHELRPHQVEGVCWLAHSWLQNRSVILGDEMGLGKTVQMVSFFSILKSHFRNPGPFLVVLPLSTIDHWRREIESWTNMNVVVLVGNQAARDLAVDYEYFADSNPFHFKRSDNTPKFDVVLTTFEIVLKEASRLRFNWQCVVVDEGHRMKSKESLLLKSLKGLRSRHRVILSGTPIQNHIGELFMLLHFLDPKKFNDEDDFMERYGNMEDRDTLKEVHEMLQPRLLRRMKEDVMKEIPVKTETVVKARMTLMQKMNYKALLERNTGFLCKGVSTKSNMPNLTNLAWSLRQVCNHPYLLPGARERIFGEDWREQPVPPLEDTIKASAKLLLLDKMLTKIKAEGGKVLIFSQMLDMLDILEDHFAGREWLYERLDGGVAGKERQNSIDRFNDPKSGRFIFMLSTRAGGVGINLTSANTVIIFDSDWNPQNDLQAQARCHRIGQKNAVKVYRLITEGSYEEKMFEMASRKIGLDRAVLAGAGDWEGKSMNDLSGDQLETMLKHGVYALYGDQEEQEYEVGNIDQILEQAQTITYAGPKENTGLGGFSKAVFTTGDGENVDLNDAFFWEKILPKAVTPSDLLKRLDSSNLAKDRKAAQKFLDDLGTATENAKLKADMQTLNEVCSRVEKLRAFDKKDREWAASVRTALEEQIENMDDELEGQAAPDGNKWGTSAMKTFLKGIGVAGLVSDGLREYCDFTTRLSDEQCQSIFEAVVGIAVLDNVNVKVPSRKGFIAKGLEQHLNEKRAKEFASLGEVHLPGPNAFASVVVQHKGINIANETNLETSEMDEEPAVKAPTKRTRKTNHKASHKNMTTDEIVGPNKVTEDGDFALDEVGDDDEFEMEEDEDHDDMAIDYDDEEDDGFIPNPKSKKKAQQNGNVSEKVAASMASDSQGPVLYAGQEVEVIFPSPTTGDVLVVLTQAGVPVRFALASEGSKTSTLTLPGVSGQVGLQCINLQPKGDNEDKKDFVEALAGVSTLASFGIKPRKVLMKLRGYISDNMVPNALLMTAISLLPRAGKQLPQDTLDRIQDIDSLKHKQACEWWVTPKDDYLLLQAIVKEGMRFTHILRHYFQCPSDDRPALVPEVMRKRVQQILRVVFPFVEAGLAVTNPAQGDRGISMSNQKEIKRVLMSWGKCEDWDAFRSKSPTLAKVPPEVVSAFVDELLKTDEGPSASPSSAPKSPLSPMSPTSPPSPASETSPTSSPNGAIVKKENGHVVDEPQLAGVKAEMKEEEKEMLQVARDLMQGNNWSHKEAGAQEDSGEKTSNAPAKAPRNKEEDAAKRKADEKKLYQIAYDIMPLYWTQMQPKLATAEGIAKECHIWSRMADAQAKKEGAENPPKKWTPRDDETLLRAVFKHGLAVRAILLDTEFSFDCLGAEGKRNLFPKCNTILTYRAKFLISAAMGEIADPGETSRDQKEEKERLKKEKEEQRLRKKEELDKKKAEREEEKKRKDEEKAKKALEKAEKQANIERQKAERLEHQRLLDEEKKKRLAQKLTQPEPKPQGNTPIHSFFTMHGKKDVQKEPQGETTMSVDKENQPPLSSTPGDLKRPSEALVEQPDSKRIKLDATAAAHEQPSLSAW